VKLFNYKKKSQNFSQSITLFDASFRINYSGLCIFYQLYTEERLKFYSQFEFSDHQNVIARTDGISLIKMSLKTDEIGWETYNKNIYITYHTSADFSISIVKKFSQSFHLSAKLSVRHDISAMRAASFVSSRTFSFLERLSRFHVDKTYEHESPVNILATHAYTILRGHNLHDTR